MASLDEPDQLATIDERHQQLGWVFLGKGFELRSELAESHRRELAPGERTTVVHEPRRELAIDARTPIPLDCDQLFAITRPDHTHGDADFSLPQRGESVGDLADIALRR